MSNVEANYLVRDSAPVFAALGDSTRLHLVGRLSDGGQYSISQLCSGMALTRQGVTKHLRVLEGAGIVVSRRHGRENRFAFDPASIVPVKTYLDYVSAQWDVALSRLQAYVESSDKDASQD